MSNTLTVTEVVNSVTVTPVNNTVEITTGISAGSTSTAGVLQLTNSVSSTSTTTAATPASVKTAYDVAFGQVWPFMSGYYYKGPAPFNTNQQTPVANTTYYVAFFVGATATFDRILVRTSGSFAGTASVRMGIYNSTNGKPSTVLLDAGTISATAANTNYLITINQTLTPGMYFLAANTQTAASANRFFGIPGSSTFTTGTSFPLNSSLIMVSYYSQASVTGAFATATSLVDETNAGGLYAWLRAA